MEESRGADQRPGRPEQEALSGLAIVADLADASLIARAWRSVDVGTSPRNEERLETGLTWLQSDITL
jgi:hypothetical protein